MLSQAIWWSSIALEVLVLIQGLRTRLAFRYPVFFSYILFVLVFDDILSFFINRWSQPLYLYSYWITEFAGVVLGCGVVLEIFRVGLQRYPGTARMARVALVLVFLLAMVKGLVAAANDPRWWLAATTIQIEAVVRTVQALAILALVVVFLLYSIPVARNLRGILLGYGVFVAVLAICLTFVPSAGHGFWFYASSASFLLALGVWLGYLWSYSEGPVLEPAGVQLEYNYLRAAAATRRRFQTAREQLARAVRP
jgi:hypothetical protein